MYSISDRDDAENCRAHSMNYHDIFISYRVASEGIQSAHSSVALFDTGTIY